jgi:hypothetical protein
VPNSAKVGKIPRGKEFDRRWMTLDEKDRKELSNIASSGATHDDPYKAALVGGLALMQLDRLKRWWMWLIAPVFAGLAVMLGDLLGASRNYLLAVALTFAGWGLLLWQRRQFRRALEATKEKLGAE